jgi:hypothetical protein
MTTPTTSPASDIDRETGLVARVASELHLPLLGKGVLQSFRLTHLMLGFLAALVVFGGGWLLDRTWIGIFDTDESPFGVLGAFWPTGGPELLESRLGQFQRIADSHEVGASLVVALAILIAAPFLGAIARSMAMDVCRNERAGLMASAKFAIRRTLALVGAPAIPLVTLAITSALIALFGLVLLSAGFTQPIGGVLFVLPLLIGLAGALIGVVFVCSHCMLAPATAVDGADAIDAIQRGAGYVLARPIRFVIYVIVLAMLLGYAYGIVQTVFRVAIDAAEGALPDSGLDPADAEFTAGAVTFWVQILWLVFIGWVISFYGTASTVLYLIMREACDGQDVSVVEMKDA